MIENRDSVSFVCDAHVHIYPDYSLSDALHNAAANLGALSCLSIKKVANSRVCKLLCLTERYDCNFFSELCARPESVLPDGFTAQTMPERGVLKIILPDSQTLLLYAGRQIVTAERLELLSLTSAEHIPDGLAFADALGAVKEVGAVPVLNWAPGKWMFARRAIVEDILEKAGPRELLLGDTSLRPPIWREPSLMKQARLKKFGILAGSDPLPIAGEENLLGTYGITSSVLLDLEKPVTSLRNIFLQQGDSISRIGARSSTIEVARRLHALKRQKRR